MKNLTIEYLGYKLEIEIALNNGFYSKYQYIKGTCNCISFSKDGYYTNYSDIIKEFMKVVDEEEDNNLSINDKTYLIKYDEENKEYYVMFTSSFRITGKSIDEVKGKIKEIYWAFN